MSFLAELKRRNVIRVALFYIVSAWLLVQVAETVLPLFEVPDSVLRGLIILLALGFVPTLVFAWVFEWTPEGIRLDSEARQKTDSERRSADKLNWATLVVALLAIGFLVLDRVLLPASPPQQTVVASQPASAVDHEAGQAPAVPGASIAVLPFADLSPAGDQEYFSDGIAEEILNVLVKVQGLQVASRTSAFGFKGRESLGIRAIARELGVRHVLEGSVRRAGNTLRITAQLIDAEVDRHLWSETFDRPLTAENVFAIQSEIARAVANELEVTLGGWAQPTAAPAHDLAAYDLYLRGLALWQARGEGNMLESEALFQAAIERDPGLARAWAGLGLVHAVLPEWTSAPADRSAAIARDAAERALALDRDLPEPYIVLAYLAQRELRFRTSQALYERALALAPSHATGHQWFGFMLSNAGNAEQAVRMGRRAVELDPKSLVVRHELAGILYTAGQFEEAQVQCQRLHAEAPGWGVCHVFDFGRAFAAGDRDAMRALLLTLGSARGREALALAEAMANALGETGTTRELARQVVDLPDGFIDPSSPLVLDDHAVVLWLAAIGQPEQAVVRLARHAATQPWYVRGYLAGGRLDFLRCQPGFDEILRTVQFPPDANGLACQPGGP
jgi:adenylate cyclase